MTSYDFVPITKFGRVLLSEYNTEYGLENHADYRQLKKVIHELQKLSPHDLLNVCDEKFFSKVSVEMKRVMEFYQTREKVLSKQLFELQSMGLGASTEEYITELYIQLHMLYCYQKLNFFGLKKLLEKFTKRCAMKSITLQAISDQKYSDLCELHVSNLDIGEGMDFLIKVLMQVSSLTRRNYELAQGHLDAAVQRDFRCRPRILDNTMAAFFRPNKIPRREVKYHVRVVSGSTNPRLAHDVETLLGRKKAVRSRVAAFANGEIDVQMKENVIGDDLFVIQSIVGNPRISCSSALVELMLMANALTLEGVGRLTAVIPYLSYADSNHGSAVAAMIRRSGVQHIITIDVSADQVEGYFHNIPVDNITARKELVKYTLHSLTLEGTPMEDVVVVSCDSHSVARARSFADSMSKFCNKIVGIVTAFIPPSPQKSLLVGNVQGKTCIIVDNVIDEGTLIIAVTDLLLASGAVKVKAVVTHGVFSSDSVDRLGSSGLQEIVVTDSLPYDFLLKHRGMANKARIVPIAPLLSEAIERVHTENTLSTLFK